MNSLRQVRSAFFKCERTNQRACASLNTESFFASSLLAPSCLALAIPQSPKIVTVFLLISVNTSWMRAEPFHYDDKINRAQPQHCSLSVNMNKGKYDGNVNSCSVITSYWFSPKNNASKTVKTMGLVNTLVNFFSYLEEYDTELFP